MSDLFLQDGRKLMLINGQNYLDGNDRDRIPIVKLFMPFEEPLGYRRN